MTEYFRGAFFYLLCFLAGCGFAALVFGWSLHSHRIEARENADEGAERVLRRAFGFGLRQLAFFLALGICSFLLTGGLLWLRLRAQANPPLSETRTSLPAHSSGTASTAESAATEQSITTSYLTGVRLPRAAQTVNDSSILDASTRQLQRLVQQADADSRLGAGEVLMWRGVTHANADALMNATTKALQKAGWLYKTTGANSDQPGRSQAGVREFVAVNPKQKKIVTGFWLVSDQFLLLSWGEVVPKGRE